MVRDAASDVSPDAASEVDGDGASTAQWQVVQQGLDEAVLAIWGNSPTEVWMVGADKGAGPVVLHGDGASWTRRETGTRGDLWWVTGPCPERRILVGQDMTILVADTATAGDAGSEWAFKRLDAPDQEATLFGAWGATCDEIWVVGGHVYPASGPPVLLRVDGAGSVAPVTLPSSVDPEVTLFKVWGVGADSAWAIGERGTLLRWNGEVWSDESLSDDTLRLVTMHGHGDDRLIVGGAQQALILKASPNGWVDTSPSGQPALNGVFVGAEGRASAAGFLGNVVVRDGGVWDSLPAHLSAKDWHATWVDPRGDVWVVGGNLLSATALDQGVVMRWGPSRQEVPEGVGSVIPAPPPDDVESGPENGPETVEAAPETVEPLTDVVEDTAAEVAPEVIEIVDDVGPEAAPDASEGDVAPDTVTSTDTDAGTADTDTDTDADADTAADTDIGTCCEAVIGTVAGDYTLTPWQDGQPVEIVQGPQGGIHLEPAVMIHLDSDLPATTATITGRTLIAGEEVGTASLGDATLFHIGDGNYVSGVLPIVFEEDYAEVYKGFEAIVELQVVHVDVSLSGAVNVVLKDSF